MPSEDIKTLEFNQNQKGYKAQFVIYADLECSVEKTDRCTNNTENSFTTKVPSGFSISTILSFKRVKNNHDLYRGNDCMKKFFESLRETNEDNCF